MPPSFHDLTPKSLDGADAPLARWRGKPVLVVNVASECGFTPQYDGLQKLHADLSPRGFAVLGFPSNEFGAQEPGTPAQIRDFCTTHFGVTFPMFAKVETKTGPGQSPVYRFLAGAAGAEPRWNFCKYLVSGDGRSVTFFDCKVPPEAPELRGAIEAALGGA